MELFVIKIQYTVVDVQSQNRWTWRIRFIEKKK